MKELNMSWADIKKTPSIELQGLYLAFQNYTVMHAFDGYDEKDVATMAKNKPDVRTQYLKTQEKKKYFEKKTGVKEESKDFKEILRQL